MTKITQLIDTFQPNHYDISLTLERLTRLFHGTVSIIGTYKNNQPIKVHSKELTVSNALINGLPTEVAYGDNDEVTLSPSSILESGEITITLDFSGKIVDSQHGIYPCYYEYNGESKEFLATQFEPHHAREAFPCIDEPAAKATFSLTLTTESDVTVLSNMPLKNQETIQPVADDPDTTCLVSTFETTPKMSTYLLAFAVGEMHSVEAKTKDGVDVRVWSSPAQAKESLQFALETSVRTIEFFDDYFGTPYPLPKSDHIALPDMGGGAAAAMENWGLITYREDYLIVDDSSSVTTRQNTARTIVHEVSHQWFGNLVTMAWWDDLWLNESFASLMEYVGIDALFPEWNHWDDFVSSETLPSLRRDSNPGVQSIKTEIHHPDEIATIFDGAIVYAKGAAVLRMLLEYVGEDKFRQGLQAYFKKHAYGNTTGTDLWDALDPQAAAFILPWLEKSGFPVVDISKEKDGYTLTQEEFLIGSDSDRSKTWPLLLEANQDSIPRILREKTTTIKASEPIQLNIGGKSQYIVNYDQKSRESLIRRIAGQELQAVDRLRLLLETTLLIRSPKLASSELVSLLSAYGHETKQPVWDMIGFSIGTLKVFVDTDDKAETGLKKLSRELAKDQAVSLGWQEKDNESEADTRMRATVLGLSIYGDDTESINTALGIYETHSNDLTKIDGELRALVLSTAVRHGNTQETVDHLLGVHDATHNSELQEDIISGLTGTRDGKVIKKLLSVMEDPKRVRPQNAVHWFVYCLRNRHGREYTWQWVRDNWSWVEKTYGSDKSYDIFPRVLGSILSTEKHLREYEEFFDPLLDSPSLARAITIGKGEIKARSEWLKTDRPAVIKALRKL